MRLGEDIVRPDLFGWRRERLVEPDSRPIEVPPDWVCEVLSESNEAHDRVTKRRLYASHGISHYWIVDPEARTLEALALEAGRWVDAGSFDESAVARVAPFTGVELPIGRLFFASTARAQLTWFLPCGADRGTAGVHGGRAGQRRRRSGVQ